MDNGKKGLWTTIGGVVAVLIPTFFFIYFIIDRAVDPVVENLAKVETKIDKMSEINSPFRDQIRADISSALDTEIANLIADNTKALAELTAEFTKQGQQTRTELIATLDRQTDVLSAAIHRLEIDVADIRGRQDAVLKRLYGQVLEDPSHYLRTDFQGPEYILPLWVVNEKSLLEIKKSTDPSGGVNLGYWDNVYFMNMTEEPPSKSVEGYIPYEPQPDQGDDKGVLLPAQKGDEGMINLVPE